ncbi:MAG: tetraacyldisaccharide 4'-kinase [Pseudomonadota bacterium]
MHAFAHALERAWGRPPRLLWLLFPLELIYAGVTGLRRRLFRSGFLRSGHPGCPVIVVGNISVGGTGKTPVVIALADALGKEGWRCAVVCRGYGGSARGVVRVAHDDDPGHVGDEALLLARSLACAVYVGRDRLAAAKKAREDGAEVLVCDDGLQHYRLRRDVEVVTVDAAQGFGNGHLLPVGPLREPRRRLARVDFLLQRGGEDPHSGLRFVPRYFRSLDGSQRCELAAPCFGPRVHALAGIARPDRFFKLLRELELDPVEHGVRDHYAVTESFLSTLEDHSLVMTSKDAVKYGAYVHRDAWVLEMGIEFPEGFLDALIRRLRPASENLA